MPTTWVKSANEVVVSGVLAGFARDWGINPWLLRAIYVVLTLATGILPGVLIYLVLSLVMK